MMKRPKTWCHPETPYQGKGLCRKCYLKTWYKAHPEIGKKYWKKNGKPRQIKSYGITVEEYDKLLLEQGGCCATCKLPPEGQNRICIDHNHVSNRVRGLLCTNCNISIGLLKENPDVFAAIATYLRDNEE